MQENVLPLAPATPGVSNALPAGSAAVHRGGPTDPSHDERLRRGILETAVSPGWARALTILFVLFIFAVPVSQEVMQRARDDDSVLPELFHHRPTRQSLRQFEDDIEQASYAKDYVQPRVQSWLTAWGRVGNKKAVVGHDGWLYYQPGVASVGGPGFLTADTLEARARAARDAGGPEITPDPRPAILSFHRALAARGITLVIFPVPDKASLQPTQLDGRPMPAAGGPVPRNVDWGRFLDEMRSAGVAVFDAAPPWLQAGDRPRFLTQDTHWTPAWMETVAGALASFAARVARLPPTVSPAWRAVAQPVSRVGDIVDMLKLPDGQTVFAPETVTIDAVENGSGGSWEPDEKADVLLLGDSFTNVFSLEGMGWGAAAGLAPHLALALGRPVDVIAQNDSGAFATRQALARELGGGHDRLAGKRVVIWEFASRELAVGDWKEIAWRSP